MLEKIKKWVYIYVKRSSYIIYSVSEEEEEILNKHHIHFTVRDTSPYLNMGKDIEIKTSLSKIERIFKLMNRESSYPKVFGTYKIEEEE